MDKDSSQHFKVLFKDNWNRAQELEKDGADLRSRFEAIYNCFENVSKEITGRISGGRYIDELKTLEENNLVKSAFEILYNKPNKEGSFLFHTKKLRSLQPFYNNRSEQKYFLTKEEPFETFLDVLYVIRNNVRHGDKEFTIRSDEILTHITSLLYLLTSEVYKIIFSEEIKEEEKKKDLAARKSIDRMLFWTGAKFWLVVLFVWICIFLYLFGWVFLEPVDCINNNCSEDPRGQGYPY